MASGTWKARLGSRQIAWELADRVNLLLWCIDTAECFNLFLWLMLQSLFCTLCQRRVPLCYFKAGWVLNMGSLSAFRELQLSCRNLFVKSDHDTHSLLMVENWELSKATCISRIHSHKQSRIHTKWAAAVLPAQFSPFGRMCICHGCRVAGWLQKMNASALLGFSCLLPGSLGRAETIQPSVATQVLGLSSDVSAIDFALLVWASC